MQAIFQFVIHVLTLYDTFHLRTGLMLNRKTPLFLCKSAFLYIEQILLELLPHTLPLSAIGPIKHLL